jgi:hypothetical protein
MTRLDLALMDPTCTQRQPRKESSQHRNCSKNKRNEEKGSPLIKTREEIQKETSSERNEHTISTPQRTCLTELETDEESCEPSQDIQPTVEVRSRRLTEAEMYKQVVPLCSTDTRSVAQCGSETRHQ